MVIEIDYFKNIFNTLRNAILILDENMGVVSANRSFYSFFKVDAANTIGSLLYDLGNGQWDIPHLRVLLEDVLPKNETVVDYEIEHDFESIGRKKMLLNACTIKEQKDGLPIILLAFEDITERKRLEELLMESEDRYRRIFETASDGILLLEKLEGKIAYANQAVEIMTGYPKEECIGKKLQDIGISIDITDFPAIMHLLDTNGILNYDDVELKSKTGNYIETDIY
ncbi:MAG: PAS domain-containing protein [Geobacteraceae bacterium]|nr:PAS domain-containing protein [Geobacteraceae bacterium]